MTTIPAPLVNQELQDLATNLLETSPLLLPVSRVLFTVAHDPGMASDWVRPHGVLIDARGEDGCYPAALATWEHIESLVPGVRAQVYAALGWDPDRRLGR